MNRPPVPSRRPSNSVSSDEGALKKVKSDVKIFTEEEISSMRSKSEGLARNLSFVCLDHSQFLEQLKLEEQAEEQETGEYSDSEDRNPTESNPSETSPKQFNNLPQKGKVRGTQSRPIPPGSPNRGAPRARVLRGSNSQGTIQTGVTRGTPPRGLTPPSIPRGRGRGRGGRGGPPRGRGGAPLATPPTEPRNSPTRNRPDGGPNSQPSTPDPRTLAKSNEFTAAKKPIRQSSPTVIQIKQKIIKPSNGTPIPPVGFDYVASLGCYLPTQEARKHISLVQQEESQPQRRSLKLPNSNVNPTVTRVKSLGITEKSKPSGPNRSVQIGPCKPLKDLIASEKEFINDMQNVVIEVI